MDKLQKGIILAGLIKYEDNLVFQFLLKLGYYQINILQQNQMFVAQALADFSNQTMQAQQEDAEQGQEGAIQQNTEKIIARDQQNPNQEQQSLKPMKRDRSPSHQRQLSNLQNNQEQQQNIQKVTQQQQSQKNSSQIQYASFKKDEQILVKQTYENGWWFGHAIGKPETQGFFPSNYVKVGAKPPPPKTQKKKQQKQQEEVPQFDPNQGTDWIRNELDKVETGPVKSQYYHGIKGYKMVKIDEKNQNILKGNHVQFDVTTGLARVPVKDQAPTAKAVRQMGYYFDYHQWNEAMNTNPQKKSRPDPKKKKPKKLHLKMMDY